MLLCPSVSVSVLYSGREVIGSLVAVCLCVGSVSYLECFIVPVCLLLSCQTAAVRWELWIHLSRSQGFLAVAVSLWCCLMLQILTRWVFIALCGSLVYWFHPRWTCCLPACLLSLCRNTGFRKQALNGMLENAVNRCNQKVTWRIRLLWACFCRAVVCRTELVCLLSGCVCTVLLGLACLGEVNWSSESSLLWTTKFVQKRGSGSQWGKQGTGNRASGFGVRGEGTGGVPRIACTCMYVCVCCVISLFQPSTSHVLAPPSSEMVQLCHSPSPHPSLMSHQWNHELSPLWIPSMPQQYDLQSHIRIRATTIYILKTTACFQYILIYWLFFQLLDLLLCLQNVHSTQKRNKSSPLKNWNKGMHFCLKNDSNSSNQSWKPLTDWLFN